MRYAPDLSAHALTADTVIPSATVTGACLDVTGVAFNHTQLQAVARAPNPDRVVSGAAVERLPVP